MFSNTHYKFRNGDKVVVLKDISLGLIKIRTGMVGKVLRISLDNDIAVEFEGYIFGHTCGGQGKDGHCFWIRDIYLDRYNGDNTQLDIGDLI